MCCVVVSMCLLRQSGQKIKTDGSKMHLNNIQYEPPKATSEKWYKLNGGDGDANHSAAINKKKPTQPYEMCTMQPVVWLVQ